MISHNEFRTRILDQEPDAIALVPGSSDTVVVGTYSLIETCDNAYPNSRQGSLQILPFSISEDAPEQEPKSFQRIDFQFGIYDINFHPQYPELLGVATSDAQILLFIIRHEAEIGGSRPKFSFAKVGEILVEEPRESDKQLSIVTQFRFIDTPAQEAKDITPKSVRSASLSILLAATTQFGNTKLIKIKIPLSNDTGQEYGSTISDENLDVSKSIQYQIINVHTQAFDLEAWTTLPILYQITPSEPYHLLLLSGGDDSQLLVSHLSLSPPKLTDIDLDLVDVRLLLTLRKDHQAGLVNICDLGSLSFGTPHGTRTNNDTTRKQLILTGSYDEFLRLFVLTIDHTGQQSVTPSPQCSDKLFLELNLGGGVWKIKKLDEYSISPSLSSSTVSSNDNIANPGTQTHYILLIAGHTSGAHIVRLTITPPVFPDVGYKYEFNIEKSFVEGHESLVYAVEARQARSFGEVGDVELGKDGEWDVISTSFYDKRICNWMWVDKTKKFLREQQ